MPDLATTVPTPTDNGRTYQFTLRPGIKFSNGKTMTGQDVKATFERLFKIGDSPNAGTWYNAIEGGDACVKTPKTCDLSKGIVVNGDQITFHLSRADPEFLQQLALPFAFVLPADTPAKHVDIPPPGTGPYKWAEYKPTTAMRVVRNPFFKEWSKDAQPAGLPDVIEQKFGLSVQAEVTQVENGQADWIANTDTIPADRLPELSRKYSKQLHVNPLLNTEYMALNTNVPPFDNEKARQAVNFATDRSALVKIYGGPQLATPACQVLPPNLPGYQPYCPYTANPGSGKWTAPDMAKAQQLVEESGTAGMRVKVNSDTTDVHKAVGEYFVGLLNKLGYKATPQFLSADIQYPYVQNSKNKVQIAWSDWFADYPAAVGLPRDPARLRLVPPELELEPEHRAVLRQDGPGADGQGEQHGARGPERGEPVVGGRRQGDDGQGAVGVARQHQDARLHLRPGQGLPVQPAVVLPPGPGVGEVRR